MRKNIIKGTLVISVLLLACSHVAVAIEVAPRITDREIIQGLAEIRGDIKRLEDGQKTIQKQIEDLRDFILWGFGVTFAGIFALIGFVLWDRRAALAPAAARTRELEEREERLERVLKEVAQKDPNVAEALRHMGLL